MHRTAAVWMDRYAGLVLRRRPAPWNGGGGASRDAVPPGGSGALLTDPFNVTSRVQLRENLHCNSFEWYLRTVYPAASLPVNVTTIQAESAGPASAATAAAAAATAATATAATADAATADGRGAHAGAAGQRALEPRGLA